MVLKRASSAIMKGATRKCFRESDRSSDRVASLFHVKMRKMATLFSVCVFTRHMWRHYCEPKAWMLQSLCLEKCPRNRLNKWCDVVILTEVLKNLWVVHFPLSSWRQKTTDTFFHAFVNHNPKRYPHLVWSTDFWKTLTIVQLALPISATPS